MTGYERRSLQKRETILSISKELFKRRGIEEISMDEIAAEAHVSKVTIYKYFGSKETLVTEVVDVVLCAILEEYDALFTSSRGFAEKLRAYVALRQKSIAEKDHFVVDQACRLYSSLRGSVTRRQDQAIAYLLRLFSDGKREGAVNRDVDDDLIALHFDVLMCYLRYNPESIGRLYADPEQYKRYMTLFWSPIVNLE